MTNQKSLGLLNVIVAFTILLYGVFKFIYYFSELNNALLGVLTLLLDCSFYFLLYLVCMYFRTSSKQNYAGYNNRKAPMYSNRCGSMSQNVGEEHQIEYNMLRLKQINEICDEIAQYIQATFKDVFSQADVDIIISNMKQFSDDTMGENYEREVLAQPKYVTNVDLYHFGWNIGRRLNKRNDEIAFFLKQTFPTILSTVAESTVSIKLNTKDGYFTLPTIPPTKPLVPHNFMSFDNLN